MTFAKIFLLFTLLLIATAGKSQTTTDQLVQLNAISNPSDKRYATNEALNNLVDSLKLGNRPQPDSASHLLTIAPADSSFIIYCLKSNFSTTDGQLDWILFYKNREENKAFRYTEKIGNKTAISVNINIIPTLEKYQVADTIHNYYKLCFKDSLTKKTIFSYNDVMIKSYFTELATLKTDEEKLALNIQIDSLLNPLLKSPLSFNDTFSGFDKMGTIHSADNKIKVVSWNLNLDDGQYRYFGYVIQNMDANAVKVNKLTEAFVGKDKIENQTLNADHWFGNEYYNIIDGKDDKNKKFYTIIGGRTNSEFSKSKVVDILWFTPKNELRFGSPLFSVGKGNPRRLIYEYSSYSSMMLRYDVNSKMIVMDHLSPKDPEFQGNAQFYVPDFSYDALKFDNEKWTLISDIDLRNPGKGATGRKPKSNKL